MCHLAGCILSPGDNVERSCNFMNSGWNGHMLDSIVSLRGNRYVKIGENRLVVP